MAEWGFGPFDGDCATDELEEVIAYLTNRVDDWIIGEDISSIEIPGARANIVILTAVLKISGSGFSQAKVNDWKKTILEIFSNPEKWDAKDWEDDEKIRTWKKVCEQSLNDLQKQIS